MRLRTLFIVGLGVGYVLGARAGRPRYEQLKAKVTEAWEAPRFQKLVTGTQEFVKENAPIVQKKVITGTKVTMVSAQRTAVLASDVAFEVTGKVSETTKGVFGRVAENTKEVSNKVAKTSKKASRNAQEASRKVTKAAKDASGNVSKTAKVVRDRIVDRSEEVVEGVIITAGNARDDALNLESDEDEK